MSKQNMACKYLKCLIINDGIKDNENQKKKKSPRIYEKKKKKYRIIDRLRFSTLLYDNAIYMIMPYDMLMMYGLI